MCSGLVLCGFPVTLPHQTHCFDLLFAQALITYDIHICFPLGFLNVVATRNSKGKIKHPASNLRWLHACINKSMKLCKCRLGNCFVLFIEFCLPAKHLTSNLDPHAGLPKIPVYIYIYIYIYIYMCVYQGAQDPLRHPAPTFARGAGSGWVT